MSLSSSYQSAPATRLLATHCALCSRPLVDARSVEQGVGPICAEKSGLLQVDGKVRAQANQVVQQVALAVSHERDGVVRKNLIASAVQVLKGLGLVTLANVLGKAQLGGGFGQVEVRVVVAEGVQKQLVPGYTPPPVQHEYLRLKTPYDAGFVAELRKLGQAQWVKEDREWSVPASRRQAVWALLQKYYAGLPGKGPKGGFTC